MKSVIERVKDEVVEQSPLNVYSIVLVPTEEVEGVTTPVEVAMLNPIGETVKVPPEAPVIVGETTERRPLQ